MFDNLEQFLKRKAQEAASRDNIETLAYGIAFDIETAMQSTGNDFTYVMRKNLRRVSKAKRIPGGYSIGVGRGGGENDVVAKSGTIQAFLSDPQFKKYRSIFGPRGKMAWWGLSLKARSALAWERAKGRFGGKVGMSPYYYLQEEGKSEVGISARHFIGSALKNVPLRVRSIMLGVFNHA